VRISLSALLALVVFVSLVSCTCDCKKSSEDKFDSSLKEALINNEKTGMNQPYIVKIILATMYNDEVKSKLTDYGLNVLEADGLTIVAKGNSEALKKVSRLEYVNQIKLLTQSVYPNR
jgi:hypothetical protein